MAERALDDAIEVGEMRSRARRLWTAAIEDVALPQLPRSGSGCILWQAAYIVEHGSRRAADTRPDRGRYRAEIAAGETALWMLWSGVTGMARGARGGIDLARRLAMMIRADDVLAPRLATLARVNDQRLAHRYRVAFVVNHDRLADAIARTDIDCVAVATGWSGAERTRHEPTALTDRMTARIATAGSAAAPLAHHAHRWAIAVQLTGAATPRTASEVAIRIAVAREAAGLRAELLRQLAGVLHDELVANLTDDDIAARVIRALDVLEGDRR